MNRNVIQHTMIDRTMLNIVSLLAGATGLAVVFLDFGARQVNATFMGHNPYAVKRDAILGARDRAFLGLAATSATIQLAAEIWGGHIPDRVLTATQYLAFSATVALALAAVSFGLWHAAQGWARRSWQPEILAFSTEAFERTQYLLAHDMLTREHEAEAGSWPPSEHVRVRRMNEEWANTSIAQLEDLLELPSAGELAQRVERLQKYFRVGVRAG